MGKIVEYDHHGHLVKVDEDLKGKHRDHCLCWRCVHFDPDTPECSCGVANEVFAMCKKYGLVLPVWECPFFDSETG